MNQKSSVAQTPKSVRYVLTLDTSIRLYVPGDATGYINTPCQVVLYYRTHLAYDQELPSQAFFREL